MTLSRTLGLAVAAALTLIVVASPASLAGPPPGQEKDRSVEDAQAQREYDKAVTDFSAVIAVKPDHTWAYTSRGSSYSKLGEHELAIADFNKVLTLDPKNEEAYNNRGWARKATGDQAGACKDWNTSKRMGNAEAKIILTNNRCK